MSQLEQNSSDHSHSYDVTVRLLRDKIFITRQQKHRRKIHQYPQSRTTVILGDFILWSFWPSIHTAQCWQFPGGTERTTINWEWCGTERPDSKLLSFRYEMELPHSNAMCFARPFANVWSSFRGVALSLFRSYLYSMTRSYFCFGLCSKQRRCGNRRQDLLLSTAGPYSNADISQAQEGALV
jgi:hypothetical protein